MISRTDAIQLACKQVLNDKRAFIDEHEVKSVQLTISISKNGTAHVLMDSRTESLVVPSEHYLFAST